MDLPLGRSYLQFAGANLGFYSIIPIISMIGLENWGEFDPDGKIALAVHADANYWYVYLINRSGHTIVSGFKASAISS